MKRAIIDFTEDAKKFCTFDPWNLKIFIYDEQGNLDEVMDFNQFNLKKVREMEIPVVWKLDTTSCKIPRRTLLLYIMKYR
ncbi:MAG TPA: hypothetical protein ENG66_05600 [Thermococcus sp.]|nr:hypothetical protein [Thermococcus sp.]